MKALVIGSGGREHALCWKLAQSPLLEKLYASPGNGGINKVAEPVLLGGFEAIKQFCKDESIDLVMVGPEAPLVDGIIDNLTAAGIAAVGPSRLAAQLEGSKAFTKELCEKYNIPTAKAGKFTDSESAKNYVDQEGVPIVVKADGLAAGKGVVIAQTKEEAYLAIDEILGGKFGDAGSSIVIEEFLEGEEVSFFALVDGKTALPFGSAQDHKAVGEGDTGPNTGGMGTYSPAPVMTEALHKQVMETIINPSIEGLRKDGCPFTGVLFAGLMITKDGPKLLEYNVRFGDPETQVLMARLESDLFPLLLATAKGTLNEYTVTMSDKAALCVVMAANGYPGSYEKGSHIHKLEEAEADEAVTVFHAGTRYEDGHCLATGGRVLGVTATGNTVKEAKDKAYEAVDVIDWQGGFCRRDIGWRAA